MNQFLIKNSIVNLTQKAKKLPSVTAQDIAMFMKDNKALFQSTSDMYKSCIKMLGIEDNQSNRKCLSNIYNGKTYRSISAKYNLR